MSSLCAGRIETQELISPIAEIEQIKTNRISLSEISSSSESGDIVINLKHTDTTDINTDQTDSGFGRLIIKGEEGQEIASIDAEGNASFSGQLTSDTLNVIRDATISGTLYADEIITKHGKFGDLLVNDIAKTETPIESADNSALNEATTSAILSEEEINNLINEILASASPETTSQTVLAENISINAQNVIGDTQYVSNSLNIGGTLTLADNSINSLSGTLYLQNLGLGGIDVLAGKIVIDSSGNLTVEGDVTIKGRLAANIISPLPENDLVIDLAQIPITNESETDLPSEAAQSAFGQLLVKGIGGQIVASIDASGSATFTKLNIASANASQSAEIITPTEIKTNATAGQATLPANELEITIKSPSITENTLIYITPLTETNNKVIFVKSKKAKEQEEMGWFKVAIDTPIDKEIRFNWWIIN